MIKNNFAEKYRNTLAWFSWPFFILGFAWFYLWGISRGIAVEQWVLAVTVINFFSILIAEQLLPRHRNMSALADTQSGNDIGHGILQGASKPLMQSLMIVVLAAVNDWRIEHIGNIWPEQWSFAAQFILAFLIATLMDYLVHRSFHVTDRLWWFHAIHHDTPQMHIMKSARIHVGEEIINSTIKPLPLILLGAPTEVMVFLGMWLVFDGNLSHSNIHQRYPSWFHYLIGTVHLHNLHHAVDRKYQDSNFCGSIPLWDILFGTFNHPDKSELGDMGLANNPVPPGFVQQLLFPFKAQLKTPPHPYTTENT